MVDTGSIVGSITGPLSGMGGAIGQLIKFAVFGLMGIILIGGILWFIYQRKKWNLKVEFKLTRSNGKIVNAEWGKGYYNTKKGFVLLKRPGHRKPIEMKPMDPKQYIYGDNILTVSQVGPNTWVPVKQESYAQYVNDKGEIEYFIDLKTDNTDQLSWAENYSKRVKDTYNIMSMLDKYQTPIAIGIVILFQTISTIFLIMTIK
jgi:hypothetical protein